MRDAEDLKELFAPFAAISAKRMFSGHGVYADGLCFALHLRGEIYLKTDAITDARFAEAGAEPFVYNGHRGEVKVMSYRRLLPAAYDDPEELKFWCGLAFDAARRAFEIKAAKKTKARGAAKSAVGSSKRPAAARSRKVAARPARKGAER